MKLEDRKENIYTTHNGLKRDFDETKLDEMIELLEIVNDSYNKFYEISRKAIFRKSRSNKILTIGACLSSITTELEDIKAELELD